MSPNKSRRWRIRLWAGPAVWVAAILAQSLGAQQPLTVVITAEQFRADYFPKWERSFSSNGFRRLREQGAYFPLCRYEHLASLAAPNAATLATGADPNEHGIVADWWYDAAQQSLTGAAQGLLNGSGPLPGRGESPALLRGSTLSDELRLASGGQARVVSISSSPAPAVMLAGRRPSGCYWMAQDGSFQSSAYYAATLPGWVAEFNEKRSALRFQGRKWLAIDAPPGLKPLRVLDIEGEFRPENYFGLYQSSPFAMSETFAFAQRAIEAEKLGAGPAPSLLWVNLGAPARLGLETGAQSPLMRDLVLRLDAEAGRFLDWLDERYGLEKVTVIFAGLHGIPPLPEDAAKAGLRAGRIRGDILVDRMNRALTQAYGPAGYIAKYVHPFAYLSESLRALPAPERAAAAETAAAAVRDAPGVAGAWAAPLAAPLSRLERAIARTLHTGRSGDVVIVFEPFHVEEFDDRGTAPGSPYRYDTDVPLLLLGPGVRPGTYNHAVDAVSIAPTLAALLGLPSPSSARGRILAEALSSGQAEGQQAQDAAARSGP